MSNTFTDRLKLANPAIGDYNWSDEWYRNNFVPDLIANDQLSKNRIIEGGVLSDAGSKNIGYTAGSAIIGGITVSWNAGTIGGVSGDPALDFLTNWIYITAAGVVSSSLNPPTGTFLMLGFADVDQTTIDRVVDLRSMLTDYLALPAVTKIVQTTVGLTSLFVYNTANDLDGGEWVRKATTQSWYWETLNTATRGRKREFPAVSLLVYADSTITIYDLTESDVPMWMKFIGATNGWIFAASFVKTVVRALNGVMCAGHLGNGGITKVNFLPDNCEYIQTGKGFCTGTVSQRNSNLGYVAVSSGTGAVNAIINDIAMTLIPGRALNVYGLTDPCILAATAGGLTVLDGHAGVGTAVDDVYSAGAFVHVFVKDDRAYYDFSNAFFSVPLTTLVSDSSNSTVNTWQSARAGGRIYYNISSAAASIPATIITGTGHTRATCGNAFAGIAGVSMLFENPVSPADGMMAHITKDYNTGWMKGDIRRALICEAAGTTETLTGGTLADRSVKATSFVINGSLTRQPIASGAELQWLTGWSSANYLSQAHSAELDFGTGDFYMSCWFMLTSVTGFNIMIDKRSSGNVGFVVSTNGTALSFLVGALSLVSSVTMVLNTLYKVDCCRASGVSYIYVNGVLTGTQANTSTANSGAATKIGELAYGTGYPMRGYIGLARIGAGVISPEQVLKMYNDEKPLTTANAKCKLQNNSNLAQALSYNPKTNLLRVGQDTGTTEFVGLAVVSSSANSPVKELSDSGVYYAIGTTANATVTSKAINHKEEIAKKNELIAKLSSPKLTTTVAGAGQTTVILTVGYYPEQVFDAGLYKAFTVTFNGFNYIANFASSTGTIVVISRRA